MSTDSTIDPAAIEKLKRLFKDEFNQHFTFFLANTQVYLNTLETALKESRHKDANAVAHKLVSSTGQYGAIKLGKLARDLEYMDNSCTKSGFQILEDMKKEFTKYQNYFQFLLPPH